jgi:glycosyltransferase involved in cell wall biosynthesis
MGAKTSGLKVAIVYDMMYPYNVGGVEVRNYGVAKRLRKAGHEVHLFGAKLWDGEDMIQVEGIYYHGVCRYSDPHSFKGRRKVWEPIKLSLLLFPELLKGRFDVIDCSSFPYFPCFTCKLVSLLRRTPLVITWHQYWGDYWFHYLGRYKGFLGFILEELTKRLTKHNIAVSEKTKNDLGLRDVEVIHNGVDITGIAKTEPQRVEHDLIYVGRLIDGKNVDLLIKSLALAESKPRLIIIGDGPEGDNLQMLAERLNLHGNIEFRGFLDNTEVYSHMKSSKVFVFPSTFEGFGMVVAEAMACGLPVVVVRHKWNAAVELVVDKSTGLIVDESEKALAEAVDVLMWNGKMRGEMSERAIIRAREFKLENQSNKLIEYYAKVTVTKR